MLGPFSPSLHSQFRPRPPPRPFRLHPGSFMVFLIHAPESPGSGPPAGVHLQSSRANTASLTYLSDPSHPASILFFPPPSTFNRFLFLSDLVSSRSPRARPTWLTLFLVGIIMHREILSIPFIFAHDPRWLLHLLQAPSSSKLSRLPQPPVVIFLSFLYLIPAG